MRIKTKTVYKLFFLALMLTWSLSDAVGSGYHPDFDEALKNAKIIVAGPVTRLNYPKSRNNNNHWTWLSSAQVYRMKVAKVYKGNVKVGDSIRFWDPQASSTASYFIANGKTNLTFLIDGPPDNETLEKYDFGGQVNFTPISNSVVGPDRMEEYNGWTFLLNMVLCGQPENNITSYRKIIASKDNRYILNYILEHWPEKIGANDEQLFRSVLMKHLNDPYITRPIHECLLAEGKIFPAQELVHLLRSSDELSRVDMIRYVNASNIEACKEIIFGWVSEQWGWDESIQILAKLAPDYFRDQLRKHDFPFWELIPCLQELHINGSVVGKRDYSEDLLKVNGYTLRTIGDVVKGDESRAVRTMENPEDNQEWRTAFPLLNGILTGPDSKTRRLCVALMRTFGETVELDGDRYKRISCEAQPPISIEIIAPEEPLKLDKPIILTLKETSQVENTWISFEGEVNSSVSCSRYTRGSGSGYGIWGNTQAPKNQFVRLTKGKARTSTINISSSIDKSGEYEVSVNKFYPHDGICAGIDAWTGVVFSKPIKIIVIK